MRGKSNNVTKKQSVMYAQVMMSVKPRNKAEEELGSGKCAVSEGRWGVKDFLG